MENNTKKAVVIFGSYHEKGMVSLLVERFIQGFAEARTGNQAKVIDLNALDMEFCRGCWSCTKQPGVLGQCVIDDQVNGILPELAACDVLVYATPVYEFGPTAIMKKFMERNLPIIGPVGFLRGRNPKRKDKAGVVILSSGAPWPINIIWGVNRYPSKMLAWLCRLWSCGSVRIINAGGMEGSERLNRWWLGKSYRLGLKLGR